MFNVTLKVLLKVPDIGERHCFAISKDQHILKNRYY